jgi:hypothetical protein
LLQGPRPANIPSFPHLTMIKRLSKGIVAPPQKKFLYDGQALYRLG